MTPREWVTYEVQGKVGERDWELWSHHTDEGEALRSLRYAIDTQFCPFRAVAITHTERVIG